MRSTHENEIDLPQDFQKTVTKKQLTDYKIGEKIGEGAYSKVFVAREKSTGDIYAIKIIKKALIIKLDKKEIVFRERNTMEKLRNHPFFVSIFCSFQDRDNLFFVMDYARRGELLRYINHLQGFNNETTKFYASEIVSALEFMHSKNIVHRDLKPENILVNENFHIMITDFGTSRILQTCVFDPNVERKRSSSFVGTAQYVSPELLIDKQICKSSDLWSLGIIIYQMVTSNWPFDSTTEYYIFEKIKNLDYTIPLDFPEEARHLVVNLLKLNPFERLGDSCTGGYPALKAHPFFNGVDWSRLIEQNPPAQMKRCKIELLPTVSA